MSWLTESHGNINQTLNSIESDIDKIEKTVNSINENTNKSDCAKEKDLLKLVDCCEQVLTAINSISQQVTALQNQVNTQAQQIQQILNILTPNPAVSFTAEITTP